MVNDDVIEHRDQTPIRCGSEEDTWTMERFKKVFFLLRNSQSLI